MRLVIDSLVALMLAGILAGVVYMQNSEAAREYNVHKTVESVRQLEQMITLQAALERTALNDAGFPRTMDPEWFKLRIPENSLLESGHLWLEVAGFEQRTLDHPPQRVANEKSVAAFWYNPHLGIIRARVPRDSSDQSALALYNQVNATNLSQLFGSEISTNPH